VQRAIPGVGGQPAEGTPAASLRAQWRRATPASRSLVVACALGSAIVVAVWLDAAPAVAATGLSLLISSAAALVDLVERRLPNELVGAAALPVGVAAALALAAGSPAIATGALAGAALLGAPLLAAHVVAPSGMGFGDVKAGTVVGAAVGLVSVPAAALGLLLALAGSGGWAVLHGRRHVALGPGLVAGAVAALVVARLLDVEAN
jgi:leader peptidase (prepilin peptidase)/N-methyltransferase